MTGDWSFETVSERPPSHSHLPVTRDGEWWTDRVFSDALSEWRAQDAIAARDEVARFVTRAQRGECATTWTLEHRASGKVLGQRPLRRTGGYRFVDLEELREAVLRRQEENDMSSATPWRDMSLPPLDNEAVAQIMQERGVTRRTAYRIHRRQTSAEADVTGVTASQRTSVMTALLGQPEAGKDNVELIHVLHKAGVSIDGHDTSKTLWSLQKSGWVTFRERGKLLYAIRVTARGRGEFAQQQRAPTFRVKGAEIVGDQLQVFIEPDSVERAIESVEAEITVEPDPVEAAPTPVETVAFAPPREDDVVADAIALVSLNDYPKIQALRDRHARAKKINEAVKLLEEVGEDDAALSLMGKVEFTDLEWEVMALLEKLGVIRD